MIDNFEVHFYQLNQFLKKIVLKKAYLKKIKNKVLFLNQVLKQNYKKLNSNTNISNKVNFLVGYVIKVHFSRVNTFTQITNSSGVLKLFCSAGTLFYKGKNKKARKLVLANLTNSLIKRLNTLKNKAAVLHLKSTGFKKRWITNKLGKKIFIKSSAGFNVYPHNGCRKKKICSKRI